MDTICGERAASEGTDSALSGGAATTVNNTVVAAWFGGEQDFRYREKALSRHIRDPHLGIDPEGVARNIVKLALACKGSRDKLRQGHWYMSPGVVNYIRDALRGEFGLLCGLTGATLPQAFQLIAAAERETA